MGGDNRGGWVKIDSPGKIFISQSNLYRSGCSFDRELSQLISICGSEKKKAGINVLGNTGDTGVWSFCPLPNKPIWPLAGCRKPPL